MIEVGCPVPVVTCSDSVATCFDSGVRPLYCWSCQPTYANAAMSSTPNEMPTPNPIAKELFDLPSGLVTDCPWFVAAPIEVVTGFVVVTIVLVPVVRAVVDGTVVDVVEMPLHTAALISGT